MCAKDKSVDCIRRSRFSFSAGLTSSDVSVYVFHNNERKISPIIASFAFVVRQALPPHPNACGLSPHPYATAYLLFEKEKHHYAERHNFTSRFCGILHSSL